MKLFSTEQVSKWHPDKYADQISDAIVALAVSKNKNARVAVETMVKDNIVIVAGEVGKVVLMPSEIFQAALGVANELGYKIDTFHNYIGIQSAEINQAVDNSVDLGAGDQGMMYGYACKESASYLPYGFDLANKIIDILEQDTIHNPHTILKGDAKTQVTVDLDTHTVHTILVSACHKEELSLREVQSYIKDLLTSHGITSKNWLINPAGLWTYGGPSADSGLTGRKIVADQYGGYVPVGGGAFSGKDLSKVDRSGAYFARNLAVQLLNKYSVEYVEIQIAYAIGVSKPISVNIKTDNPNMDGVIERYVKNNIDFRVSKMIESLGDIDYKWLAKGCHYR